MADNGPLNPRALEKSLLAPGKGTGVRGIGALSPPALTPALSQRERGPGPSSVTTTSSSTIDDLLAGLNPQQREAATHGDGPLLIVAGAGTGKTATLVHRVAWLIAGGRRSRPHPAADLHPPGGRRNAPPGREPAPPAGPPGHDARLGRNLPRHRHPAAAPLRQGRSACRRSSPSTTAPTPRT